MEIEDIVAAVDPYTATSTERLRALIASVRYVVSTHVPGDIVECGVWRGGSMMAAALTLRTMGAWKQLHLFDTYEGMTPPTDADVDLGGNAAADMMQGERTSEGVWAYASLEEVQRNFAMIGWPDAHFIKGPVEDTIPINAPDHIALLRLDTDWYESTKHELEHLIPRVSHGGVVIIDDYGHWKGARKAVDEWLLKDPRNITMHQIDYTGRLFVLYANPGPFLAAGLYG